MNIENIKSQFPIFSKKINGKPLVYLDSSNSSQNPLSVINSLDNFYKNEFSNIVRSIHSLAVNATNRFEETRISVKNFVNAEFKEEIIFTKNATESINLVATTYGQQNIEKGDEILITELEHHSNYVPWHYLRETKGAVIKFAPIDEYGDIIIDKLSELITSKTKIIALTHLSNVTGTIVPIKEIVEISHKKNIPVYGNGLQIRDWINVSDHCEAINKVLHRGKIGEIYNIGSSNEKINLNLIKIICKIFDEIDSKKNFSHISLIKHVKDRLGHDKRYSINSSKIRRELNWKPKISFNEGIKKTIKWYLKNHNWK